MIGFGIPGGYEWIVILVIVLLLFGHRLPGMARSLGSGITEFKRGLKDGGLKEGGLKEDGLKEGGLKEGGLKEGGLKERSNRGAARDGDKPREIDDQDPPNA